MIIVTRYLFVEMFEMFEVLKAKFLIMISITYFFGDEKSLSVGIEMCHIFSIIFTLNSFIHYLGDTRMLTFLLRVSRSFILVF